VDFNICINSNPDTSDKEKDANGMADKDKGEVIFVIRRLLDTEQPVDISQVDHDMDGNDDNAGHSHPYC
jgi:hypothetical protein